MWKTVCSVKFTKSKARNFAKNQWNVTKLTLEVIDLHAKNQLNICKRLEKKSENCSIAEIYEVKGP